MSADVHADLVVDVPGLREKLRVLAIADVGLGHPQDVRDYVEHFTKAWPDKIQEAADRLLAEFGPDIGATAIEHFIEHLPVAPFVRLAQPAAVLPLRP